ncbi:MAG: hypothetical protein WA172_12970 [Terriglobales bacterium]
MKRLAGFVVMTLLVLGCSSVFVHAAPSGPVQFGLMDSSGTVFCDYIEFSYGSTLASGIDVQSVCLPGLADGTMLGVVTTIPGGSGLPVTGPIVMLADAGEDAFGYAGYEVLIVAKTKASLTKFGWETLFVLADDPVIYLGDWGYLTKHNGPIGPLAEGQSSTMRITALPAGFHKPSTK